MSALFMQCAMTHSEKCSFVVGLRKEAIRMSWRREAVVHTVVY